MKFKIKRRKLSYDEMTEEFYNPKYGCGKVVNTIGGIETKRRIFILEQISRHKWEQLVVIRNDYPQDEIYHPNNHRFKHQQLNRILFFELFGFANR